MQMQSEYYGEGWLGRRKTISCSSPEDDLEDDFEDYSFEEASIYLNSFTVNHMASLTASNPSRRMLNSTSTLSRRAMISPYCMILGLAYAKLYHQKCAQSPVGSRLNTLDLFLVSMILSNKFLIDNGEYEAIGNKEWARLSSKTIQEVNQLETQFLNAIDWKLYMSPHDFRSFSQEVEAKIVTDLVRRRGYCTYGEILSLFNWEQFNAKFHTSIRNMGIAFLSSFVFYLTGVLAFSVALKGLGFLAQVSSRDPLPVSQYSSVAITDNSCTPAVPPISVHISVPVSPNLTVRLYEGDGANGTGTTVSPHTGECWGASCAASLFPMDTPWCRRPGRGGPLIT